MDSSSVASSTLVTRELFDAERLRKLETLRRKLFLLLAETGSTLREELKIDGGGDCWEWICSEWHCGWGVGWRMRLGEGEGQRREQAVDLYAACCGSESGERVDWLEKETTEGFLDEAA
jgi:hypothetical protein